MSNEIPSDTLTGTVERITFRNEENGFAILKVAVKGRSERSRSRVVETADIRVEASRDNPVFYVQYAHARISKVLRDWCAEHGGAMEALPQAVLARLDAPTELALMAKLAAYPDMLTEATQGLAPHDVAFYLRDLAGAFHSYYAAERFLVDDAELCAARMALLAATAQVLRNGLALLGVSAPASM